MKKIYQTPTTTVVNVKLQQMIADSIQKGQSYNGSATIESRRGGSVWDDDEE